MIVIASAVAVFTQIPGKCRLDAGNNCRDVHPKSISGKSYRNKLPRRPEYVTIPKNISNIAWSKHRECIPAELRRSVGKFHIP
ncbi:MAG: hypothetical protein JOZ33_11270 [Acidobacteriaceae bacterium]|nr:hypothetical protein [Acidobacteriaceae bacterium]